MSFTPKDSDLAQSLGALAIQMENQLDSESVLRTIVAGAVSIVPGVRWAGLSLIHGQTIEARVPSDPIVAQLDTLQSALEGGPCITALREGRTVRVDDMSQAETWPAFASAAMELGVHSSLSFQLFIGRDNFGALNLYGDKANAFDDESDLYGEILAQHAAVAMAGSRAAEQMHRALDTRDIIGQAKGIVMERFDIDATAAFALLTRYSQETNTKLAAVAARVAYRDTGAPGSSRSEPPRT